MLTRIPMVTRIFVAIPRSPKPKTTIASQNDSCSSWLERPFIRSPVPCLLRSPVRVFSIGRLFESDAKVPPSVDMLGSSKLSRVWVFIGAILLIGKTGSSGCSNCLIPASIGTGFVSARFSRSSTRAASAFSWERMSSICASCMELRIGGMIVTFSASTASLQQAIWKILGAKTAEASSNQRNAQASVLTVFIYLEREKPRRIMCLMSLGFTSTTLTCDMNKSHQHKTYQDTKNKLNCLCWCLFPLSLRGMLHLWHQVLIGMNVRFFLHCLLICFDVFCMARVQKSTPSLKLDNLPSLLGLADNLPT